ncbi:unnamed protein product [marine sediment metagenome]|uniref:Uncharacterized protein n=1 Tax=marine sediment metagenome TaxID=412755 RepID=X1QG64_9ZZZZ
MNLIILDADELIKVGKIGLLSLLAESYNCIISKEVFKEAIERGKKYFHEDAFILESYINQGTVKIMRTKQNLKAKKLRFRVNDLTSIRGKRDIGINLLFQPLDFLRAQIHEV